MNRLFTYLAAVDWLTFRWHKLLAACCIMLSIAIAVMAIYLLGIFLLKSLHVTIPESMQPGLSAPIQQAYMHPPDRLISGKDG